MASFILCLFLPNIALAEDNISKGLILSPLRNELDISPGISKDGILKVTNSTDESMRVTMNAEEFSVINQQYDYAFTVESNVAKWVKFDQDDFILEEGDSKEIKFSVGVPLSAEPGGRYISLFANTDITVDDNVNTRQRIASLLYITVLGDVSRTGDLLSLKSQWLLFDSTTWSAALRNTGSTHYRSRFNVQIKNIFNGDVITTKSGEALILPNSIRTISDTLQLPKIPGIYKAVFTIGLGDTPAVIETKYIVYLPSSTVGIIGLIAVIIWFVKSRLKPKSN